MIAPLEIKRHISSKIKREDLKIIGAKLKKRHPCLFSGLHFGHYKSVAESKITTKLHTAFLNMTIISESVIELWTKSLSIMLEKLKENIHVDKLRRILSIEADCNFFSKLLLDVRLMHTVESRYGLPEELGGSCKLHKAIYINWIKWKN